MEKVEIIDKVHRAREILGIDEEDILTKQELYDKGLGDLEKIKKKLEGLCDGDELEDMIITVIASSLYFSGNCSDFLISTVIFTGNIFKFDSRKDMSDYVFEQIKPKTIPDDYLKGIELKDIIDRCTFLYDEKGRPYEVHSSDLDIAIDNQILDGYVSEICWNKEEPDKFYYVKSI